MNDTETHSPTKVNYSHLSIGDELDLGVTRWFEMPQERIDGFAKWTEDLQWIHVDPERAATGPFATTIAHGFLTLSLLPAMRDDVVLFEDVDMIVSYGLDKVRFTGIVPVNSRVRARCVLTTTRLDANNATISIGYTVEVEGLDRPACIADWLLRLYPKASTPN